MAADEQKDENQTADGEELELRHSESPSSLPDESDNQKTVVAAVPTPSASSGESPLVSDAGSVSLSGAEIGQRATSLLTFQLTASAFTATGIATHTFANKGTAGIGLAVLIASMVCTLTALYWDIPMTEWIKKIIHLGFKGENPTEQLQGNRIAIGIVLSGVGLTVDVLALIFSL